MKNPIFWVKSYVMLKILIFRGFLTITQSKTVRLSKFLALFHILDQNTTFLFYKFFTLLSAKNAILQFSRKTLHEIFFNTQNVIMHTKCHQTAIVPTLEAKKTPTDTSGAVCMYTSHLLCNWCTPY